MELVKLVYRVTATLPPSEEYGLIRQMRRAVISIPSNIAEGSARQSNRESVHFYIIARASLSELDAQIELCISLGFLDSSSASLLSTHLETADSLLSGVIRFKRQRR